MEPAMQCCRTRGAAGARQHEARSRATEGFLRLDLREGPDSVPLIDLKVGFGGRHAWSLREDGACSRTRRFGAVIEV